MRKSWSVTTRYFVLALILAGLVWLVGSARALIGPLAISALLAYILNPVIAFVNMRTKLSRHWVVLLTYILSLAILVALAITFAPLIPGQLRGLAEELRSIELLFEERLATPLIIFGFQVPLSEMVANLQLLSDDFIRPDIVFELVQAATTNIAWILVILVTTYYLLQDWHLLREWLINVAPGAYKSDMRRLYHEMRDIWQRYLRGQLRLSLIVGVLTGLVSAAIGLPGALAFGILAGVMDVILSVGPAIVITIAGLVAWFAGSTYLALSPGWFAILVVALLSLIQLIENVWLRPRIMGHSLRMHPAVVFVAIIGSLTLAGVLVALIIIPVLGSAGVIGRYVYAKILDVDPWPEAVPPGVPAAPTVASATEGESTVTSEFPARSS